MFQIGTGESESIGRSLPFVAADLSMRLPGLATTVLLTMGVCAFTEFGL
jgi:hypothetical protein